ncbi:MAG: hypothetical protein WA988_08905 [Candidatus Nanopelagicales bacterium]
MSTLKFAAANGGVQIPSYMVGAAMFAAFVLTSWTAAQLIDSWLADKGRARLKRVKTLSQTSQERELAHLKAQAASKPTLIALGALQAIAALSIGVIAAALTALVLVWALPSFTA